jgi:hypothetical protein
MSDESAKPRIVWTDAHDFWEMVAVAAYAIEGENRLTEREYLAGWLSAHPEIRIDGPIDHYAMHAVARLAAAFLFNDAICVDPRALLRDALTAKAERQRQAEIDRLLGETTP